MDDQFKLDLAKYQTDQIATTVVEILSVGESLRTVLRTVSWVILILFLFTLCLNVIAGPELFRFFATMVSNLALAVLLGFLLGLIRVANNLVANIEQLLQMIINTSRQAVSDMTKVQQGKAELPAAGEIVRHVYEDVFLPLIEKAVAETVGFVGMPLLWVYRATIGSGVRYMIAKIEVDSLDDGDAMRIEKDAEEGLATLASSAPTIDAMFSNIADITGYGVRMIRLFLLRPIQVLFAIVVIVALVPVVVFWIWLF